MKTVSIGNITFGTGIPKLIVPIAEKEERKVYSEAREYKCRQTDIIEWRADFLTAAPNASEILRILKKLRKTLGSLPLIFTCRTDHEAGAVHMEEDAYIELYREVIDSGLVDAIDIETERYKDRIRDLIARAHQRGVIVIGSDVFPENTPAREALIECMEGIRDLGADIIKIAAMNQCAADALRLMDAAREMVEERTEQPVIATGMGIPGVITRMACEAIGTCATYGAVHGESASGQFSIERLQTAIKILHNGMEHAEKQ